MKKICATCGKAFEATSNRATYCSEECRKIGVAEKQKLLMRKKRKEEKIKQMQEVFVLNFLINLKENQYSFRKKAHLPGHNLDDNHFL